MFTRDCLRRTLERNEDINGKNETLAKFAHTLAAELSSQFPTEMTQYRLWKEKPSSINQ
jgi:mediator of RNA polymerase II transcription subunit 10